MLSADGGSFKDPSGRVYRISEEAGGGRVVRGLSDTSAAAMDKLLSEPFFRRLAADGDVVKTRLLDREDPAARRVIEEGWAAVVEHEAVDFVTWPYEWPFSMLKDAALLQLRLLETSARNGWILKDATPFNIQWMGARPVFIDVPSFVPWKDGEYWQGYRQFCSTFLMPLMLTAHLGIPFQPLLRSRLEGIPPEEAARYFYGLRRFRRGVLSHVWFPAKAERRARSRGARESPRAWRRHPKTMLLALLDSLKRLVSRLSYAPASSDWARYSETHSYDEEDFERKRDFVERHTSARRPELTWDLGGEHGNVLAHRGTALADGRRGGRRSGRGGDALPRGARRRATEYHPARDGHVEPVAWAGMGGARARRVRREAKSRHGALSGPGPSHARLREHPAVAVRQVAAKLGRGDHYRARRAERRDVPETDREQEGGVCGLHR